MTVFFTHHISRGCKIVKDNHPWSSGALFMGVISCVSLVAYFTFAEGAVISGVSATNIAETSAQVVWTTDVPSSSHAYYMLMSESGPAFSHMNNGRCDAGGLVTEHCAILTGLSPGTMYAYKVESIDASGTAATKEVFTFTTTGVNSIYGVSTQGITASGAQVVWQTSLLSNSSVAYGTASGSYTSYDGQRCDGQSMVTNHCVNLSGLLPNTTYYYRIESFDNAQHTTLSTGYQFTTSAAASTSTLPVTPVAPSGLVLSADGSNKVQLSWTDNSSDENRFEIYMRMGTSVSFAITATVSANVTSYNETSARSAGTYQYLVKSCNSMGCTPSDSAQIIITTSAADGIPPTMPSSFAAVPYSSSQVNLSWGLSTDNVGVYAYRIYQNGAVIASVSSTVTSYSINSLSPSTNYLYKVIAYDTSGNASTPTSEISVTTLSSGGGGGNADTIPPTTPSSFVAVPYSSSQINLSWGASADNVGVSGYRIYRNGSLFVTLSPLYTTYSAMALIPSTNYSFRMAAYDAAGNVSTQTPEISVTTLSYGSTSTLDVIPPTMPSLFNALIYSPTQVRLSWSASTDNIGVYAYRIYRNSAVVGMVSPTLLSFIDTGLVPNVQYVYKMSAVDASGNTSIFTPNLTVTMPTATATVTITTASTVPTATGVGGVPVITNVFTLVTGGGVVQARWNTDLPTNGKVYYGTSTNSYKFFSEKNTCETTGLVYGMAHCIVLPEVLQGSKYYYRVISQTPTGVRASSPEYYFLLTATTAAATGSTILTTTPTTPATTSAKSLTMEPTTAKTLPPVSFSVKSSGTFCLDGRSLAHVYFSASPLSGGKFLVPETGVGTGVPFEGKMVDIPSGTYTWTGIPNPGFIGATPLTGIFTINKIPECKTLQEVIETGTTTVSDLGIKATAESVKIAPNENEATSTFTEMVKGSLLEETETKAIPTEQKQTATEEAKQADLAYAEIVKKIAEQVEQSTSESATIAEKLQVVQTIRESTPPAPQSDVVHIGAVNISRAASPEFVMKTVAAVLDNRATTTVETDGDKDGISDYDETHIYGTDLKNADTDGDGIRDGAEILAGTNPLEKNIVPVLYEDPKQVTVALQAPPRVLTVESVKPVMSTTTPVNGQQTATAFIFEGRGLKNSYVTLYFFSTPVVVTVKTDSDGKWAYTIEKELENGSHQMYVAMTDSGGKVLVKSTPIPFIKTANAVTFGSAVSETAVPEVGFFGGKMLYVTIAVIAGILSLSFIGISIVLKRREV